jgi:hypothetical protein
MSVSAPPSAVAPFVDSSQDDDQLEKCVWEIDPKVEAHWADRDCVEPSCTPGATLRSRLPRGGEPPKLERLVDKSGRPRARPIADAIAKLRSG